jgi:hypothetical protein
MKSLSLLVALGLCSSLFANDLALKIKLSENESYQLYEHMNLVVEAEEGGKRLVKKSDEVYCSKTSYYIGDFEYACYLTVQISEAGHLTR